MKQFQVPQFITVEDKVIGPFTVKQFLYIGSAGLLIIGAYKLFQQFVFVPFAAVVGATGAAFAFLKINEQPFPVVVRHYFFYIMHPRLYVWKQEKVSPKPATIEEKSTEPLIKNIPKLSESRLSDLAWSLDIKSKRE